MMTYSVVRKGGGGFADATDSYVCNMAANGHFGPGTTPPYNPGGIDFGDVDLSGFPNDCRELGFAPVWEDPPGGGGGGGGGSGGGGSGNGQGVGSGCQLGLPDYPDCIGCIDIFDGIVGPDDCNPAPPPIHPSDDEQSYGWRKCLHRCDYAQCAGLRECQRIHGGCDVRDGDCSRQVRDSHSDCRADCGLFPHVSVVSGSTGQVAGTRPVNRSLRPILTPKSIGTRAVVI